MKSGVYAILFLLISGNTIAQTDKQYWNWYFGNLVAIQFSSNQLPPVLVMGSMMGATEGASSISDTAGNLLFYSNGQSVWNNLHQAMPNGSSLEGHFWSAQSALFVRKPGSDSLYYLFTVNNWTDTQNELNYSIIDKSLDNGLGDVTSQKNILINAQCAEHLTAAYHANGTDIWILSHEVLNNHFVAYLLTASGLNTVPVVSAAGALYTGANRYGYMRVSPGCNKIATALGKQTQMQNPDTTAQVFDFDNATGIASNAVYIADLTTMESAYCCEFSPDNSKVYFTEHNGPNIYQVDLNASVPSTSLANIASTSSYTNASLTLGPDNKIYVTQTGTSSLGVINSPNDTGVLCDHIENAVVLSANNSISTCNVLKPFSITTLVEEYTFGNIIDVFPNPASVSLTIQFNTHAYTKADIRLYDITGRLQYFFNNITSPHIIPVESFSPGVYFISATIDDEIDIRKIVIE